MNLENNPSEIFKVRNIITFPVTNNSVGSRTAAAGNMGATLVANVARSGRALLFDTGVYRIYLNRLQSVYSILQFLSVVLFKKSVYSRSRSI